ncbi:hypothetical protein VUR80DRAFT_4080 [Thermomyces stellatus]
MYRGNEHGVLFHHLRGSRAFALAAYKTLTKDNQRLDREECAFGQVLLEVYAFCEFSTGMRLLPDSGDIEAACESEMLHDGSMLQFETFGVNFGFAWGLYRLIPFISRLAARRKEEIARTVDLGCASAFLELKESIDRWKLDFTPHPCDTSENDADGCVSMGLLARTAITLFLLAAYSDDSSNLRSLASPLVDEAVDLAHRCSGTPWETFSYWPVVVIGSFASTEEQRQAVRSVLWQDLRVVDRAREILGWLWARERDFYGLHGLAEVIRQRNTSWCC